MDREIWVCTSDDRCGSICRAVFENEYALRFIENPKDLKELVHQRPPDLVIFHSSRADECIKTVKAMKRAANVPVFLISGRSDKDLILKAWKEGACGFLAHPPSTEELYSWVSKYLGNIKVEKSPLERVREYIEINYDSPIALSDLAARVGWSAGHLCRIFKDRYGLPPMTYLQRVRLDKARRLLENTDMDIAGIGREVGFRKTHYFCREFKKRTGMSPIECRMTRSHQRY